MNEAFNKWWNSDELIKDNPFSKDTPAFWAWEGWVAGVRAEREACAALCDKISDEDGFEGGYADRCAFAIRERGAP